MGLLKRLWGLVIIVRTLLPVLVVIFLFIITRQAVLDARKAMDKPIQAINSTVESVEKTVEAAQDTAKDIKEGADEVANTARWVVDKVGGVLNSIGLGSLRGWFRDFARVFPKLADITGISAVYREVRTIVDETRQMVEELARIVVTFGKRVLVMSIVVLVLLVSAYLEQMVLNLRRGWLLLRGGSDPLWGSAASGTRGMSPDRLLPNAARIAGGRAHWRWLVPLALLALTAFFVLPHMPPITVQWNPPAAVTYPAPLDKAQLNATANIPGQFIYEPPRGTVLHAAPQQELRLTFHTVPLPSPWRELAILSGLLALASALAPAVRAWRGRSTAQRLRVEMEDKGLQADASEGVSERVQRAEARRGDPGDRSGQRSGPWWSTAELAVVVLCLAGLLRFYLVHPRTASTQQYVNVLPGKPSLRWDQPAYVTYPFELTETQLNAVATVPGTFVYVPPLHTQLNASDDTQPLKAIFTPESSDYRSEVLSNGIRVFKGTPTLTWTDRITIPYGIPLGTDQLDPRANVPGAFTFNPFAYMTLPVGNYEIVAKFRPQDSGNWDDASISATLTVLPGDPGLKWSDPADVKVGTALGPEQLNAKAGVPGKFVYAPGEKTVLKAGAGQPLTVTFQPDNKNYAAASCTVHITVTDVAVHQAQFLKNGDLEGGFTATAPTTMVGTHWGYFNNGDYHYGYYDDPWDQVRYDGDHSQLIEIGAPGYAPGDRPNRLSGISQTVRGLIPNERYTLTLHGIIRVSGDDPSTGNPGYVAQWGVAPGASAGWKDVENWNPVPWTRIFPYLSAGPVQTYTTTFTAPSDTLTLFIGLLKRPGKGNTELNLNLDGLSLVGPTYDPGQTLASR